MASDIAKKINRNLLKEQEMSDYYFELGKELNGKKSGQWTADFDEMSGVVYWINKKFKDFSVVGTPFWEGMSGIPVDVRDKEDRLIFNRRFPWRTKLNTIKDVKSVIGIMKGAFKHVERSISDYQKRMKEAKQMEKKMTHDSPVGRV